MFQLEIGKAIKFYAEGKGLGVDNNRLSLLIDT